MSADDASMSPPPPTAPGRPFAHPLVALFTISFVILFFELACIRWFGSTVVFLTFFTNIVLLACVLGMSAGCLAASRRWDYLESLVPVSLLAAALAQATLWGYYHRWVAIDVGDDRASPQQVYFGTETPAATRGNVAARLPIEVIAGAFYTLIALMFVGLGQVLGRALAAVPNRLTAYTTNIVGSLAGIVAFSVAAYARTPPVAWFVVALVPALGFLKRRRRVWLHATGLAALLFLVAWVPARTIWDEERVYWSPYYKVLYLPELGMIFTNNISHQQMVSLREKGTAYLLPCLLNRDSGGPPREDVLIIGAGSGNDVAAALLQGARHVDAVEIDPLLYELGRADHPDRPYQDPRVSVHLDDGRIFLRRSHRSYDQVVYALVDSLVLHSGYSSLRLESFLFTEQAFAAVRERLKHDGVFVMYNYFRHGFVIGRLVAMAERVFGTRPIVLSFPYQSRITPGQTQQGAYTLVIVGRTEAALAPLRARFARGDWFWFSAAPGKHASRNAFGRAPPEQERPFASRWHKLGPAAVDTAGIGPVPTDDWPFLYLRSPTIPAFNLRGMAFMAGASLLIIALCVPVASIRPSGSMFFLGAGFMLLETRGVVHLALLFGSTWIVNSIVFFAILVMVLLSNLYVRLAQPQPRRTRLFYGLLFAALVLNLAVPAGAFLPLPPAARVAAACALVFVPVFFAGIIFATAFRDSPQPDVDLGANIAGVVLGGLSEYLSLVVGMNGLLVVACVYYLLAALLTRRSSSLNILMTHSQV